MAGLWSPSAMSEADVRIARARMEMEKAPLQTPYDPSARLPFGGVGTRVVAWQSKNWNFDLEWNQENKCNLAISWMVHGISYLFGIWLIVAAYIELRKDYFDHWFDNTIWSSMVGAAAILAAVLAAFARVVAYTNDKKPVKERTWPYAPQHPRVYVISFTFYLASWVYLMIEQSASHSEYLYNKNFRFALGFTIVASYLLLRDFVAFAFLYTVRTATDLITDPLPPPKSPESVSTTEMGAV